MQRILVALAALAAMIAFTSPSAFAQKGKTNCSYEVCVAGCTKNGGQPRFCGDYCTKQISSRKAAGRC